MTTTFQDRYFALVAEIERDFRVAQWKKRDLDLWPVARMDLFLDMHRRHTGEEAPPSSAPPGRVAALLAMPFTNVWKSRRDLRNWIVRPFRAHAVLLGDGVSLDLIDGAWQDRFGESLIAELERQGQKTFVMQPGDLNRLPWQRPTFAANLVDLWSRIARRWDAAPVVLPDLDEVQTYLREKGIEAPSLRRAPLERRAATISKAADGFALILKIVQPKLAFVVTYYAGLAPAFLLACRRLGILSVDLQHCPQDGAHKAYVWSNLPDSGYSVLPAAFWTWSRSDADHIDRWATPLSGAMASGLVRRQHTTRELLRRFGRVGQAVQSGRRRPPIRTRNPCRTAADRRPNPSLGPARENHRDGAGQLAVVDPAASRVARTTSSAFGRLLSLRGDNVVIEQASAPRYAALLPRMTASNT